MKDKMEFKTEPINIKIEINPEKRTIYMEDDSKETKSNSVVKRYYNKKDIVRIFANHLYNYVNFYQDIEGDN